MVTAIQFRRWAGLHLTEGDHSGRISPGFPFLPAPLEALKNITQILQGQ